MIPEFTDDTLRNIKEVTSQVVEKKKKKKKTLPDVISEEEFLKLLVEVDHPHHRLAFKLGFYEGMRISEVVKLRKDDIDLKSRLIHIREAKGAKDRMIPIMKEILPDIRYVMLFEEFKNTKSGIRALQIAFKKAAKMSLGKDMHFHQLRHSCATMMVTKKWPAPLVQQLLGHSNISTTQIYFHVQPTDLVEMVWGKAK